MSKSINSTAFSIAHSIKRYFTTFAKALKAAWVIAKIYAGWPVDICFVKDCGEIRDARAVACSTIKTVNDGFLRFVEMLPTGKTQWRAFKVQRLIV